MSSRQVRGAARAGAARGGGRERITAAARRLFSTRSYGDVSMRDVAEAAGVTKAALYYHFRDKQDLFTEVSLQLIDGIREAMEGAIAGGGTLEDQLVKLAEVGMARLQSDVFRPHITSHAHLDAAHHARLHEALEHLPDPAIRCFEQAGQPDPQLSARAAAALLGGMQASLILGNFEEGQSDDLPKDRRERARLVIRVFLDGYWAVARGEGGGR